ncbi:MAG: HlyU family transcriptional regulator [Rhizobiaceae bacterium]
MSFLKRLFGGGSAGSDDGAVPSAETVEHAGYSIRAAPIRDGGQFRLCAVISRDIDGETRTHKLIRADMFMSADDAADAALRKAKLVIAEQGDAMFD